tara:strand:+ start:874 stop:1398 length:525 start_codon:yes stop_codon:yes gene_type:complete
MSQLKVDSIVPRGGLPSGATGGGIIQTLQTTRTDFVSTTSSTFSDYMSLTITPQASSSKILCMFNAFECTDAGDGNTYSQYRLMRGSSHIFAGDQAGSGLSGSAGRYGRQSNFKSDHFGITFIDSPNTTSATTYKIQFRSSRGGSFRVSIGGALRTEAHDVRNPSNFILMEVSG